MGEMEGKETPRFFFGWCCLGEDEEKDVEGEGYEVYEKEVSIKRTWRLTMTFPVARERHL